MRPNFLDLWDASDEISRPRSRLYSLEPLGLGTGLQEALISYLVRLANAHSVPPLVLINREIIQLTEIRFEKSSGNFSAEYAKTINLYNKYAREFSRVLGSLTCRDDLLTSTFIPWKDVFDPKGAGMLSGHPRWCTECLQTWREENLPSYFPLHWYAHEVKLCVRHNRALQEVCPHCGRHQPFIPKHYYIDHCSQCGGWLGHSEGLHATTAEFTANRFDRFAAEAIAEIIQEGANATTYATYPRLQQRLNEYAKLLANGVAEFERTVGFRKSVINQWISSDTRPKPLQLLTLCYRLGTTPVRLLRDDVPTPAPLIQQSFSVHSGRPRNKLTANDRKWLLAELQSIIDSPDEPISLKDACTRLGYTNNFLKYWFSQECRAISDKRKQYVSERKQEFLRLAEETAYQIVKSLLSERKRVSRRTIDQHLQQQKLSLLTPEARAGMKRAKAEFFSKRNDQSDP